MNADARRKTPEQDSDYDGAWKEALRRHLPSVLQKFFPTMFELIDWGVEAEWLDKEISQILGQSGRRNREVDVLFKVRLRSGELQWILFHLEVQTSYEADFVFRLVRYNAGLLWTFQQRVITLAILADLREDWLPQEDVFRLGEFQSRLRFPVCKLIAKLKSEWEHDRSLPVQVARAQVAALRTAGDPEGRYRAKWQLVRNLYDAGYNVEELREIFRLLDWMLHLRDDLSRHFERELVTLEEDLQMPYVTSVERIAEERGRAEGLRQILVRLLPRVCGPLPGGVQERVGALSVDQLERLGEELLDFATLADLTKWLDEHPVANREAES